MHQRRVTDPEDNATDVAAGHPRRQQVGPGLFQGRFQSDQPVEVSGSGRELMGPGGDPLADVLLLVLLNQAVANVLNVDRVVVDPPRLAFDISLDVGQQLVDPDRERLELQFAAVAEAVVDRGGGAGRSDHGAFEPAPASDDLVESLVAGRVGPLPKLLDCIPPGDGGSRILLAVFEDAGQQIGCRAGQRPPPRASGLDKQSDVVVLVGQLESPNAAGQPRDRLALGQAPHGPRPRRRLVVVIGFARLDAGVLHGLDPELAPQETGTGHKRFDLQDRINADRLGQRPPPALAVRNGRLVVF